VGKAVTIFMALATLVHVLKPLGLPSLKKRSDAWKIAVFGLALMVVLVALRPD
jgi:hypothetical protein